MPCHGVFPQSLPGLVPIGGGQTGGCFHVTFRLNVPRVDRTEGKLNDWGVRKGLKGVSEATSEVTGAFGELLLDVLDLELKPLVGPDEFFDLVIGMHDGRVVFAPKSRADLTEGVRGQFASQEHRHLPREGHLFGAFLGHHIGETTVIPVSDGALDGLDRYAFVVRG
jgi:hypothetical protein